VQVSGVFPPRVCRWEVTTLNLNAADDIGCVQSVVAPRSMPVKSGFADVSYVTGGYAAVAF